jgi:peptidoglycan/LPS O-acetylase OafA/YrhL
MLLNKKQDNISINYNIYQIHLVRAIACIGVVITHARFVLWSGGQAYLEHYPLAHWRWYEFPLFFFDLATSLGRPRVFFFFLLSGFFLQYSARTKFCTKAYLRHRFLRLYPAYLAATLVTVAVFYVALTYINPVLTTGSEREFNELLRHGAANMSWGPFRDTLLFIRPATVAFAATPHFWSMPHEVVFCLLFPFYHRLSVRKRLMLVGTVLVLGWTANSLLIQTQLFFLLGMLGYDFFSLGYRLPWLLPNWAYYGAFLCLYLATYGIGKLGWFWLSCVPMVGLAFLLFDFVLTRPIRVPKVCVFISKASYAIYLNHFWALLLYYAVLSRFTGELVFYNRWPYYSGVLVAVLLSLPAYWLVDKRIGAYLGQLKLQPVQALQSLAPLAVAKLPSTPQPVSSFGHQA